MKSVYLYDRNDIPRFEINYVIDNGERLEGVVKQVLAWEIGEYHKPDEYTSVIKFIIKKDGCSHYWFNGEDVEFSSDWSIKNKDKVDGYYHLCGFNEYINFTRGICFAYEVAKMELKNFNDTKDGDYEEMQFLMNEYKIKYELE